MSKKNLSVWECQNESWLVRHLKNTFFSGLSTILHSLLLICCSSSNLAVTSSMESCRRSQNPARSWAVGRGIALGSCTKPETDQLYFTHWQTQTQSTVISNTSAQTPYIISHLCFFFHYYNKWKKNRDHNNAFFDLIIVEILMVFNLICCPLSDDRFEHF